MDDFIYFLLVIGWLGYSFYKQSEKKKLRQAARQTAQQDYAVPAYTEPVITEKEEAGKRIMEPDFRKTLEEILLGDPLSLEEIPQNEAQSLEVIPEAAVSDENRFQKYSVSEIPIQSQSFGMERWRDYKFGELGPESGEVSILKEEEIERIYFWEEFDLRRAVIYSEILQPKYVH